MQRRDIISGLGAAAAIGLVAGKASANTDEPAITSNRDVLVTVFLRGAADGLNLLPPYNDGYYTTHRSTIRINDPVDIDGYFGMHPAFASLNEYVSSRPEVNMAFIPAVGNPLKSHSHFDAMNSMEYANGGTSGDDGGWLGRYLTASTPTAENAVARAIAVSTSAQKSLDVALEATGYPASTIAAVDSESFQLNIADAETFQTSLCKLYGRNENLDKHSRALLTFIEQNTQEAPWLRTPDNGAEYPTDGRGLGDRLRTAADFITAFKEVEIVNVDMGGWDTHSNETSRLNALVTELADSLEAFCRDMGSNMQNITVLVMTEFGRRIKENDSYGTDHGTGSCMIALGGGVNGGVHAKGWRDLVENPLELSDDGMQTDHGDLAIKVDFRDVFAQLMQRRLQYSGDWNYAFPNYGFNELGFDLFNYR